MSTEENTLPTSNKKIKIAKVRRYEYDDVLDAYSDFKVLVRNVKIMDTVTLMKKIVPEFISRNSRFEVLDKGDFYLKNKSANKKNIMKIAVAGTGYVGLSMATLLSQHHEVMAVDIVPEKVDKINCRISLYGMNTSKSILWKRT